MFMLICVLTVVILMVCAGGFSLALGLKDVSLVSQAARETDTPMPFLSVLLDRCAKLLSVCDMFPFEEWKALTLPPPHAVLSFDAFLVILQFYYSVRSILW